MLNEFNYGVEKLTVEKALLIARGKLKGVITKDVSEKIQKSCNEVLEIAKGDRLVYSINTGFGSLCTTKISKKDVSTLQENLLKSHSVGVGNPIQFEIAKLMLILKVQSLSMGYSGISLSLIKRICWHIDNNWIALVPEQGSVGASGDLAPLSHLFLPLIGLGKLSQDGVKYIDADKVLKKAKLPPLTLGPKEGLALINGTQFIAAHAVKASERANLVINYADIIGATSLEGLLGSSSPFDSRLHDLRPHKGAKEVAKRLRSFLKGSEFIDYHMNCHRVQDPYSIRCMPQVHGASRDAFKHFDEQLETELNSVTDNPIIFSKDDTISGGNFHGQPLALPLDYLSLAMSEIGNISDRRTYLLLEGKIDLPVYLIKNSGVNSGLMIAQYCSAALASENKSLCFPASADSIPTSMGQEDHVSMGSISGRKVNSIITNVERILAVEMLCAAQAMDFRRPLKSSDMLEEFHKKIRVRIPHIDCDQIISDYINQAHELIISDFFKLFG